MCVKDAEAHSMPDKWAGLPKNVGERPVEPSGLRVSEGSVLVGDDPYREALMAIKRILLPFCEAEGLVFVAEAAFKIGRSLSAQVRGLFAQPSEGLLLLPDESTPPEVILRKIQKIGRERAERFNQGQEIFAACAERFPDVQAELVATDGAVREKVGSAARLADITVLGSGSHSTRARWQDVRDGALFGSGRPVLLIPPTGIAIPSFERIVVAWKEGVEAARAIAAAQPFLLSAKEVHLITVGEGVELAGSLRDAEDYLQLHHAEVRSMTMPQSHGNVAETLMRKCEELGGALLVMGAYSHWRWQERVFGGVTESLIRNTRVPVLMTH